MGQEACNLLSVVFSGGTMGTRRLGEECVCLERVGTGLKTIFKASDEFSHWLHFSDEKVEALLVSGGSKASLASPSLPVTELPEPGDHCG